MAEETGSPEGPALLVDRHHAIPLSEISWSFSASGGPGGQHANTANTRVLLRFDITESSAFSPAERDRLAERLGGVLRISVADERSQWRNRELALERLAQRLRAALRRDPPRVPTRPTRGSKERRLDDKRLRASTKAGRQRPSDDE
jgi:ribosome-associated protein